MAKGTNASNNRQIAALGRLQNRPTGLTSAVNRAAGNLRTGERISAPLRRLRRRPAGLTAANARAARNRRRAR